MERATPAPSDAPLLGEPPVIELGNTVYALRGRPRDALRTASGLAGWLRAMGPRLAATLTEDDLFDVGEDDLVTARQLRDTVRSLAAAAVDGRPPDPDTVATLN